MTNFIKYQQSMQFLYNLNFSYYFKYIVFFEFILSLFILLFLLFTILKRNYINIYCLYVLNIIIVCFFITIIIEEVYMYKFLIYLNLINNSLFEKGNSYSIYDLCKNYIEYISNLNVYDLFFININLPFYNDSFEFNFFRYNVKLFIIYIFILCLIFGYFQRKSIKLSFDKILLVLLPILFSNLLLVQTQDLIIAYLCIELQNLCLIFLVSLKKNNNFNIQLSIRFFILNSVGSLFLIFGIIFLYIKFSIINLSDFYILVSCLPNDILFLYYNEILFALFFIIIGLFFKLGVGPFGLWIVEIYENTITYSVVIFSILPKIGYFVFIFHLYLATSHFSSFWDIFFKIFGILSVFIGTFGALYQIYLKRLLAFSSLNYFGYILLSLIGFKESGVYLCVLYIFFYICISLYIWYIIMYLEKVTKRNIILLDLVILRDHYPLLAIILSFSFLFLAGLPPCYLFILKFYTFNILMQTEITYNIIFIFLFCSFCSIIYYLNLIKIMHFNPLPIRSYKMYKINTIIIFLIILYTLLLISPFVFIFINSIYLLFNKLLNKYIYNIYSNKKNIINYIYKIIKISKISPPFNIFFKQKINEVPFIFFNFSNYSFMYNSVIIKNKVKYILTYKNIKLLRNEIIRSKYKILNKFFNIYNFRENVNCSDKDYNYAFYFSLGTIIKFDHLYTFEVLYLRSKKYFQHLLYRITNNLYKKKKNFKIINISLVFNKENFIYNTKYNFKDKLYNFILSKLTYEYFAKSYIRFYNFKFPMLTEIHLTKYWKKYFSSYLSLYYNLVGLYLLDKKGYNLFHNINKAFLYSRSIFKIKNLNYNFNIKNYLIILNIIRFKRRDKNK